MKSHEAVVIPEGERVAGVYQEYGDLIVTLRSEGKTLQGDRLGVSRERVRQVLNKHSPNCSMPPSTEEAAKMLGMSYRRFRSIAERFGIRPIGRSPNRIRWPPDVLPAVCMAYKFRSCRMCGRELPLNCRFYCSEECFSEARRYRNHCLRQMGLMCAQEKVARVSVEAPGQYPQSAGGIEGHGIASLRSELTLHQELKRGNPG